MTYKKQQGLSLIELLIAITIGLLLLVGTASMMISNKRIYKEQNEMGRLQENARFAMELIMRDIRRAAYIGCMDRLTGINSLLNGGTTAINLFSMNDLIEGSESGGNWLPSGSTDAAADMTAGSDGFTVKFLEPMDILLGTPMPTPAAALNVTNLSDLVVGDIIAISDCDSADIMQITGINVASSSIVHNTGGAVTPGNNTQNLSKTYNADAQITRSVARRYFIGTDATTGEPGLFMYGRDVMDLDNDGDRAEIINQQFIEGIENMQILYGEDTSGDSIADTYVAANAVTTWNNVVSMRIAMLVRTIQEDFTAPLDTGSYNLLGTVINPTPDDHHSRRVFETTIEIRNRRS